MSDERDEYEVYDLFTSAAASCSRRATSTRPRSRSSAPAAWSPTRARSARRSAAPTSARAASPRRATSSPRWSSATRPTTSPTSAWAAPTSTATRHASAEAAAKAPDAWTGETSALPRRRARTHPASDGVGVAGTSATGRRQARLRSATPSDRWPELRPERRSPDAPQPRRPRAASPPSATACRRRQRALDHQPQQPVDLALVDRGDRQVRRAPRCRRTACSRSARSGCRGSSAGSSTG